MTTRQSPEPNIEIITVEKYNEKCDLNKESGLTRMHSQGCGLSHSDLCQRYCRSTSTYPSLGSDQPILSIPSYILDCEVQRRCRFCTPKTNLGCYQFWCCTCLPKWVSYMLWIVIISAAAVIVVLAGVLGSYRQPSFQLVGFETNNTTGSQVNLLVQISNRNVFGIHLANMASTAYYGPPDSQIAIGQGFLAAQWVPPSGNVTFQVPFFINYTMLARTPQALKSIDDSCFSSSQPQNLTIDYHILLDATALFVTTHPSIVNKVQFPCLFRS
ncbi:hypothetical protein DM01DRAFT_330829 [Hesseltinella vesiculosa]|uniref:Late embryogenesis abundant protein LEA-2 subgroup domain-containing protein n=1 Tax=Hesseltinella vesiculosa TaxID=101127 RepID=A0A1X2GE59_9FUNG|nr:hypothetical protein DM01DRAFT_330829 [Hesseltinella vesiculosa]